MITCGVMGSLPGNLRPVFAVTCDAITVGNISYIIWGLNTRFIAKNTSTRFAGPVTPVRIDTSGGF